MLSEDIYESHVVWEGFLGELFTANKIQNAKNDNLRS